MEKLIKQLFYSKGFNLGPFVILFKPFGFVYWFLMTAKWIARHFNVNHPSFSNRDEMYKSLISSIQGDFDYLEFGVASGESMKVWLKEEHTPKSRFYGFDTFEGLPEAWGDIQKGTYTNEGKIPNLSDPQLKFVRGLFQDTLPAFLNENKLQHPLVVHMDADLYSSTQFVLSHLNSILRAGDFLIFDEFACIRRSKHEFRAFLESQVSSRIELVLKTTNQQQVVLKVLH